MHLFSLSCPEGLAALSINFPYVLQLVHFSSVNQLVIQECFITSVTFDTLTFSLYQGFFAETMNGLIVALMT